VGSAEGAATTGTEPLNGGEIIDRGIDGVKRRAGLARRRAVDDRVDEPSQRRD
jgi:hypothetical protein